VITYTYIGPQTTLVRLNGTVVGAIIESKKGFRYFPKNAGQKGGDFYPTLAACKQSLES